MTKSKTDKSKYIAYVLRHDPKSIGLTLDPNGWASVDDLLEKTAEKHGPSHLTADELIDIVATDSKGRYVIDGPFIRAVHGHSVEVEVGTVSVPPDVLYHGTATRFLESIKAEGLKKQTRQHIHLSAGTGDAREVGSRHGKVIILHVDAKQMHEDGFVFKVSDSGIWLADEIPAKYLRWS